MADLLHDIKPEVLRHLGREYWWDPEEMPWLTVDPSFPVHDFVGGAQATALTLLMNPTKLRRVYDNEYRARDTGDVLTLAELVTTVTDAVWEECTHASKGEYSAKSPMISGFRRNLQGEHLQRLVDLTLLRKVPSATMRTVGTLAADELRRIDVAVAGATEVEPDAYTRAHLADIRTRIKKALEAAYVLQQ